MMLDERVHIARRFLRSVRIDTDLSDESALEGFICPKSSADVLMTMARHVSENRTRRIYLDRALREREIKPRRCIKRTAEQQCGAARTSKEGIWTKSREYGYEGIAGWHKRMACGSGSRNAG